VEFADTRTGDARHFPKIDCIQPLLAADVLAAAEQRAAAVAVNMTRSLLELERYLSNLKETGNLPTLSDDATGTAADRRPLPRVAA
jgi:hypothetical protein